ncbi:thyroid transcription factor 1-associated protein 26 [Emydura macquarii macquarii]|uniref:thyroid transcription factor 1-associated protein 26 n=1 Tax=Emydura macquarii macquarii TaxID=1129001 RepID=UPI00352B1141
MRSRGCGRLMAPLTAKSRAAPKQNTAAAQGPRRKRTWRPDPRQSFRGSVREGQGFAFWRKQKIQQDYKKLLKKEGKAKPQREVQYTDTYPEHLKHLYLAEEEMLKEQSKSKRNPVLLEQKCSTTVKSDTTQRKFKKTSNQKAKEEYETVKAERAKKKEAAEKRKREREEAQRLYKQKKMETYKILSKRTKKGQPNLNLQIEFLLQKIQQKT